MEKQNNKLILVKPKVYQVTEKYPRIRTSQEAYVAVQKLSFETGLQLSEVVSKLILFAAEHVEIQEG